MKELREIDIDAAPLLFHAASSRREHSCFRTAYDLVYRVLGKGGVMDQVEAVDGLGRRILMHAARSNHVQTFTDVFAICKETMDEMILFDPSESTDTASAGTTESGASRVLIKTGTDINGMNCLHHAAQAGCCEVLREVIEMYRQRGSLQQEIQKKDKSLRTPIMYVLRDGECFGEKQHACGRMDLKERFDMLFDEMNGTGWMESMPVLPQAAPAADSEPAQTEAVTELLHAARGGLGSLELALNNPLPASVRDEGSKRTVNLDEALNVKVKVPGQDALQPTAETRVWGRALLLAAAAQLGDMKVLPHVVDAIKASPKRLRMK